MLLTRLSASLHTPKIPRNYYHASLNRKILKTPPSIKQDRPRRKNYRIKTLGVGSRTTTKTSTEHEIRTDVPKLMGGKNEAPQPVEVRSKKGEKDGRSEATIIYCYSTISNKLPLVASLFTSSIILTPFSIVASFISASPRFPHRLLPGNCDLRR